MVNFHTNYGDMFIKTFAERAPVTVENFLKYCLAGFYENTIYHRIISGFLIQGASLSLL